MNRDDKSLREQKDRLAERIAQQAEYRKLDQYFKKKHIWNLASNSKCQKCHKIAIEKNKLVVGPFLPHTIGSKYKSINPKILFVGKAIEIPKNKWDDDRDDLIGRKIDSIASFNPRYFYEFIKPVPGYKKGSQYWKYINEVTKLIHYQLNSKIIDLEEKKEFQWLDYVAVTNIVKCGAHKQGSNINTKFVEDYFAENCTNILKNEIKILKPDIIIFLTSCQFEQQLQKYYFPISDRKETASRTQKKDYWINNKGGRLYIASWHPTRKGKEYLKESKIIISQKVTDFWNSK